jgi:arginase family enzyme
LQQTELLKPDYEWIDLSDIRRTSRFCEKESLEAIYERIIKRRKKGITLIGSGNYHYVSFLLLTEIKVPFTLVLFDHHTDMMESPSKSIISCGSWVLHALEYLPLLQKVIIIGVEQKWESFVPVRYKEKVTVVSHERIYHDPHTIKCIVSMIKTNAVYLSIDKDVLNETEVKTDWDQGNMTLKQLDELIFYIASKKRIIGEDICGEYPRTAVEYYKPELKRAIKKNEQANRHILKLTLIADQ